MGVCRCVLLSTMSTKSLAVGTAAIFLKLYTTISQLIEVR